MQSCWGYQHMHPLQPIKDTRILALTNMPVSLRSLSFRPLPMARRWTKCVVSSMPVQDTRRGHAHERSVSWIHLQRSATEAHHIKRSQSGIIADESRKPNRAGACPLPPSTAAFHCRLCQHDQSKPMEPIPGCLSKKVLRNGVQKFPNLLPPDSA